MSGWDMYKWTAAAAEDFDTDVAAELVWGEAVYQRQI